MVSCKNLTTDFALCYNIHHMIYKQNAMPYEIDHSVSVPAGKVDTFGLHVKIRKLQQPQMLCCHIFESNRLF